MFSEYASRYLAKSQKPAPLFNREIDQEDYLEDVSGSTDGTITSDSDSDSIDSESDISGFDNGSNDPPRDFLVDSSRHSRRPKKAKKRRLPKTGMSLWPRNLTSNNPLAFAGKTSKVPLQTSSAAPQPTDIDNGSAVNSHIREAQHRDSSPLRDPESGRIQGHKHLDNLVAVVYVVSLALSLSTAVLISVAPGDSNRMIYPLFSHSVKPIIFYSLFSAAIAALWLHFMRKYAKPMVQASTFAVPTLLTMTSLVSIVMSIHTSPVGNHLLSHTAMRIAALVPLLLAAIWVLYLQRMKNAVGKAGEIVAYAAEIYSECTPAITTITLFMGAFGLQVTCLWTYFLSNAFLEGRIGYLLILWFSFMYLWTWSLTCNLLRAVLVCVTNECYANNVDTWNKDGVFSRGALEVATFHFSSACLSSLLSVQIRAPMLLLPNYFTKVVRSSRVVIISSLLSNKRILDPLTLPTAIMERCSLSNAAKVVDSSSFAAIDRSAYRLSKFFLIAGRVSCSICVGFIAWIHADRLQDVSSSYGYIIAIVGLLIGWTVVGASENMLSMICDALLVCFVVNEDSPRRSNVRHLFTKDEELVAEVSHIESEYSGQD